MTSQNKNLPANDSIEVRVRICRSNLIAPFFLAGAIVFVLLSASCKRATNSNSAANAPPTNTAPANVNARDGTPVEVKLELDEADRAYREGNFTEAQRHAERALAIDQANETAHLLIARIIHGQYKRGDQSPENVLKARQAIDAYKQVLAKHPENEEAYKALADLYGAINENEFQRQLILQRATDTNVAAEKRSEAYVVLASKDWHCGYDITELAANKITTFDPVTHKAKNVYKKPKAERDFQTVQMCTARGLEEIDAALKLNPNSGDAWAFKVFLLLEAAKLARMEHKVEQETLLNKQAEDARRRATELMEKNKSQPIEAPPPPSP